MRHVPPSVKSEKPANPAASLVRYKTLFVFGLGKNPMSRKMHPAVRTWMKDERQFTYKTNHLAVAIAPMRYKNKM